MPIKTPLFDLTGQVALITGGASGIGLAIAKAMLEHGARVLIGSRTQDKVDQAVQQLDGIIANDDDDPTVAGVSLDVQKVSSIKHAVSKAIDLFGGLNIVINAAGITRKLPTFELEDDEFNQTYDIHITGSLRVAREAGHIFREQHQGCIINIASITSYAALTEVTAYACAKSATMGLTRSLANEWAKYGIRTNAIAPGFIPTDLNREMIEGTDRGRRILEHTPMGRFGTGEEVAGAAVYLASRAASFVNGITLPVDGGFLACGVGDATAPWTNTE